MILPKACVSSGESASGTRNACPRLVLRLHAFSTGIAKSDRGYEARSLGKWFSIVRLRHRLVEQVIRLQMRVQTRTMKLGVHHHSWSAIWDMIGVGFVLTDKLFL